MAHDLATIQKGDLAGKTAMLSANQAIRELPWHGLGQRLDRPATVAEALHLAGMDFKVDRRPVMVDFGDEKQSIMRMVPDQFVNYRTDTNEPLGVVGKKYAICQNEAAFSFFDSIVGAGEAVIETAGVLGGGRQTFITAKMPPHIFVPGDEIEPYVILINSHDGSGSIQALLSPVRTVCRNTLMMAMKNNSNRVRISHTKTAEMRLKQAGQLMGLYDMFKEEMGAALTQMAHTRVSETQVDAYIKALFSSESEEKGKDTSTRATNIRNEVKNYLYGESGGQQMFPGTAYQAYQGITGFFQNVKEYRSTEGTMSQLLLGDDARLMEKSFNMALAMGR
jgi:phage/plasmid-like protein (TIGR03299 family)